MTVALYARVSTRDKEQDPETQLLMLRAWATETGQSAEEFIDYASAADPTRREAWKRPHVAASPDGSQK